MSSMSGRKKRPSTATLQQFATSSSYGSSGASQKPSASNDNTSATTAESTSWSSRSGHHYGVFPRSHPQREHQQQPPLQQTQPSSHRGGAGSMSRQYQYQKNQPPPHQYAATPLGGRDRYHAANSPPGRSPVQQHRSNYRDDYSRSQHSDQDDASWTPPAPQTDISLETPPPRTKSQQKPPKSDPGASNRFAAYVNRFATIDPRMDYSDGMHSPTRGMQFEEKKEDARMSYHRNQYQVVDEADYYPDPDFNMEQMLAAEHQQYQRPHSMAGSVASTSVLHSPGASRTRNLARRFEDRMHHAPPGSATTDAPPPWYSDMARSRDHSQERASSGRYHQQERQQQQQQQQHVERQQDQYHRSQSEEIQPTAASEHSLQERDPEVQDRGGALAAEMDYYGRRGRSTRKLAEDYRSRSEIETPSPARVSALKQKLWDASESLNVKVRPSSNGMSVPDGMRNARSLSPKTSRRVYQHFGGGAAAEPVPSRSTTAVRDPTHFEWTEAPPRLEDPRDDRSRSSAYRDDRSRNSAPRDDRSRSSMNREDPSQGRDDRSNHTSGRDDRSQGRDDRSRSSLGESSRRRSVNNPAPVQRTSDTHQGSGGELQNSPFFKSRFFDAAAQTVEQRKAPSLSRATSPTPSVDKGNPGGAPSQSDFSHQDSMTASRFFQRQLDAVEGILTEPEPKGLHRGANVTSSGQGTRNVGMTRSNAGSAVGANSYASTPIASNQQNNVASLMAKLQSVNRADPSQALKEIDAILKQQTGGGSAVAAAAAASLRGELGIAPAPKEPPQASHRQVGAEDEDDDGESESETTVSSITNPTFSGNSKHRKKKEEAKRSQPLPTTVEGEAVEHAVKPLKEPAEPPGSRRRKARSPPPDTIQVSGNRVAARNLDRDMDWKAASNRPMSPINKSEGEGHVGGAVDKGLSAPSDPTAELAEKIRRWDELSGKGSAPDVKIPEIMSDTTDALGSIVTPADGLPNINKKRHPWDNSIPTNRGKIDMKDTSMDIGEGIETKYSPDPSNRQRRQESARRREDERNNPFADERNNPFANESDHESMQDSPKRRNREGTKSGRHAPHATVVNMSNEFDDAWVTLPTSNFFSADTPPRRTADKANEESRSRPDESPPHPPVSTKQASVQKFSPKRVDSSKRDAVDYEPPSPSSRRRERHADMASRGERAYDEKRVDQARSEEEIDDGIEVTLVSGRKETKRKGLRSLLQRRGSKSQGLGATSVVSSASRRRNQPHMAAYEAEIEPPRSASRGRRRGGPSPSRDRARSLEERRIRNPMIAKKFSRLLRVYNEEDKRAAEV